MITAVAVTVTRTLDLVSGSGLIAISADTVMRYMMTPNTAENVRPNWEQNGRRKKEIN